MGLNKLDLTSCDSEPIRIPGRIQSHGFFVALSVESGLLTHVSENLLAFLGLVAGELIGKSLRDFGKFLKVAPNFWELFSSQTLQGEIDLNYFQNASPYQVEINGQQMNTIAMLSGGFLFLEFEARSTESFDGQKVIGSAVSRILSGSSVSSLFKNAKTKTRYIS